MRNYIKAELYRNLNRLYLWLTTAICAAVGIGVNALFAYMNGQGVNPPMTLADVLPMSLLALIVPIYLIILFVDMISIEEFKNGTIKNVIAHGISREKLYCAKLITSTILAFISALIIVVVFLISGWALLGMGETLTVAYFMQFLKAIGAAIPLWISGIALLILINFICEKETLTVMVYVGILSFMPVLFKVLGKAVAEVFQVLYEWQPTVLLEGIVGRVFVGGYSPWPIVCMGIVYTIVFVGLGLVYIRKKAFN